jgi:hypothetical protein
MPLSNPKSANKQHNCTEIGKWFSLWNPLLGDAALWNTKAVMSAFPKELAH